MADVERQAAGTGEGPSGRVVIADDDEAIRGLLTAAVRKAGALVVASVGDGGAAVNAVADFDPDLVLLDVAMPIVSGLEACRRIRELPERSGLWIIMLSAAVHQPAIDAGLAAGADLYLEKPFSPRALAGRISELLHTVRTGAP